MRTDVLLVGAGPLPTAESTIGCSYTLRTAMLAIWLREQGFTVTTTALDMYKGCDAPQGEQRDSLAGNYLLLADNENAQATLAHLLEEVSPRCIVAVSYVAANHVCRLTHSLPVWADMFGWILAEAQLSATIAGNDKVVAAFAAKETTIMQRADHVSVICTDQRHATIGELGLLGRLTSRTRLHEFVSWLPPFAFDWRPHLPEARVPLGITAIVPTGARIVLWCGTYNVWTDIERIFELTENLMQRDEQLHYVSIGGHVPRYNDAFCDKLESHVRRSRFRERYHLLPWQSIPDLLQWLERADLGLCIDGDNLETVYGSRTRLVDMSTYGLPVASTVATEVTRHLVDAHALIPLHGKDPGVWAAKIEAILNNPPELERVGQNAQRYISANYALSKTGDGLKGWVQDPVLAPDNRMMQFPIAASSPSGQKRKWSPHNKPMPMHQPQQSVEAVARKSLDRWAQGRAAGAVRKSINRLLTKNATAVPALAAWSAGSALLPALTAARWQNRIEAKLMVRPRTKLEQKLISKSGVQTYGRAMHRSKSLDELKSINTLVARHEYDNLGKLLCRPQRIDLELCSACNIACSFCARNFSPTLKNAIMSPEVFQRLVPFLRYASLMEIIGTGEPLMNPNAADMIDEACRQGVYVRLYTNATRLDETTCERLIKAKLGSLVISLHAGTREAYKAFTGGYDYFDQVLDNLRTMRDMKRIRGANYPPMVMGCALLASTLDTAPEVVRIAHQMDCDHLNIDVGIINSPTIAHDSLLKADPADVKRVFQECERLGKELGITVILPKFPLDSVPGLSHLNENQFGCLMPWLSMNVRAWGDVQVCTMNRKTVGDLNEESIEEIWNGERFRDFRRGLVLHKGVNYCASCYMHSYVQKKVFSDPKNILYDLDCAG